MRLTFVCFAVACASLASTSCAIFDSTCKESERDCLGSPLTAAGYGGACDRDRDCKQGLFCIEHQCKPNGMTPRGEKCRLTDECMAPDYCGACNQDDEASYKNCKPSTGSQSTVSIGPPRVCQGAGTASLDDDCANTGDCTHGLTCAPPDLSAGGVASLGALASISGLCKDTGTGEQGDPCESASDCLAGLTCIDKVLYCATVPVCGDAGIEQGDKICAPDFELPPLPPLWNGVSCPTVAASAQPEAYFHVPRPGEDDPAEFFSLPFPNDARLGAGGVDLSFYPLPPEDLGLPIINRYVDAANGLPGFSTNPTVYFRFSHAYKMDNAVV